MNLMYQTKGNTTMITGPIEEGPDATPTVRITCNNGVITSILFDWSGGYTELVDISQKALDFANNKAKEMGLSDVRMEKR